jgi:hypothetical protein
MVTFYDDQAPFNANSTTNIVSTHGRGKEITSELNKAECSSAEGIRPFQADVNKRIQRLQENYFLERRSFL